MTNLPAKATWTPQMQAIVKSMYPGIFQTPMEFAIFKHTCEQLGLDPIRREIWPVRYGGKNPRIVFQTSIEGYIKLAKNSGKFGGFLPARCVVRVKGQDQSDLKEIPMSLFDDLRHELVRAIATVIHKDMEPQEYFADLKFYRKRDRDGEYSSFWQDDGVPFMLYKCAQSLSIRRTFSNETHGVFTQEEMDQAGKPIDVSFESVPDVAPADPPVSKPAPPKPIAPPVQSLPVKKKQPDIKTDKTQTQEEQWQQIVKYLKDNGCSDEGIEVVFEDLRASYQVDNMDQIPLEEMPTIRKYVWSECIPELVKGEYMPPLKGNKNGSTATQ